MGGEVVPLDEADDGHELPVERLHQRRQPHNRVLPERPYPEPSGIRGATAAGDPTLGRGSVMGRLAEKCDPMK